MSRPLSISPEYAAGALCALVFAAMFPALYGDFVWDDVIVTNSPPLQEWSGLGRIWFAPGDLAREQHYWPVTYTSFWLEHKLWGLNAFSCHLVNILLHLANTLLLWRLLSRLAVPGAWLAAALFAVHPVHVETAAWVITRKDLLATLFSLGCALVWLRFFASAGAQPGLRHYSAAALLLAAALLSKSVAATLPAALLLLYWLQHGRLPGRVLLQAAPLFLLAGAIIAFDLYLYQSDEEARALGYSLLERVLIAAQALCFYVGKLLWPVDLAVIYPHWATVSARGWLCLLAVCGVFTLLVCTRRRLGRGPLAGALFFALTLFPVLGFVDFSYMTFSFAADRYQYLASAGLLALAAGGAARLGGALPLQARRGGLLACALGLGALCWTSAQQAAIYRNEIRFFRHIIAHNPQAKKAHFNLGSALYTKGRMEENPEAARTHYQEAREATLAALEREPGNEVGHYNAGMILASLGRYPEAREHLYGALKGPRGIRIHAADEGRLPLSSFLRKEAEQALRDRRYGQAALFFEVLTEIQPRKALAWAGLGEARRGAEQHDKAITALQKAVSLDPDAPSAATLHVLIAHSASTLEQDDTALAHYRQALEQDANLITALEGLAGLQFARKRYPEALASFRRLAELAPDSAQAHSNLGAVLAELGQTEAAMHSLQRALALDPQLKAARANLQRLKASLE